MSQDLLWTEKVVLEVFQKSEVKILVIMAPNLAQNYDQNCEFQESYRQKLEPMYLQPRQVHIRMF